MSDENGSGKGCLTVIVVAVLLYFVGGWVWATIDFYRASGKDTVEAYLEFVKEHKTSGRCAAAAGKASELIAQGSGLPLWPEFLSLLGDNKSTKPVPVLLQYLHYPVTEIRRGAAAGLLGLAQTELAGMQQALGDMSATVYPALEDSDSQVRRDVRCLVWLMGEEEVLQNVTEFNQVAQNEFEAFKDANSIVQLTAK